MLKSRIIPGLNLVREGRQAFILVIWNKKIVELMFNKYTAAFFQEYLTQFNQKADFISALFLAG